MIINSKNKLTKQRKEVLTLLKCMHVRMPFGSQTETSGLFINFVNSSLKGIRHSRFVPRIMVGGLNGLGSLWAEWDNFWAVKWALIRP